MNPRLPPTKKQQISSLSPNVVGDFVAENVVLVAVLYSMFGSDPIRDSSPASRTDVRQLQFLI